MRRLMTDEPKIMDNCLMDRDVLEYIRSRMMECGTKLASLLDNQREKEESTRVRIETLEKQIKKSWDIFESEFLCPICNEIVVKATILECSHTFCEKCLDTWISSRGGPLISCPVCRAVIFNRTHSLIVDSFINKMMELSSPEKRRSRRDLLISRQAGRTSSAFEAPQPEPVEAPQPEPVEAPQPELVEAPQPESEAPPVRRRGSNTGVSAAEDQRENGTMSTPCIQIARGATQLLAQHERRTLVSSPATRTRTSRVNVNQRRLPWRY